MVDISSFRRDARAMRDGAWIKPGPEYGPLEIHTRAMGPRFRDALAANLRAAAKQHLTEDRIPSEVREQITTDALIEHCLLDVRGITENGAPITFARFCELIRDPAFAELNNAAFIAAGLVGRQQQEQADAALGNSPNTSGTGSAAPPPPMPG